MLDSWHLFLLFSSLLKLSSLAFFHSHLRCISLFGTRQQLDCSIAEIEDVVDIMISQLQTFEQVP